MPGAPIPCVQVGNDALGKFQQGKAQEGPLWVGSPGHVRGGGLLTSGAAGVVGPHPASGIAGAHPGRRTLHRLRAKPGQRHAGVGAVSMVDGIGQLIAEIRHFILGPGVILLVGHSIQSITVQLGGITLGSAGVHGLTVPADHQRFTD